MKIFVPLIIKIGNRSVTGNRLMGGENQYYLHRGVDGVDPRFSSRLYQ